MKFFYAGGSPGDWDTLGNWWDDIGHTTPSAAIPNNTDDVTLLDSVFSNGGPAAECLTIVVSSGLALSIPLICASSATINGTIQAQLTTTGDATFDAGTCQANVVCGATIYFINGASYISGSLSAAGFAVVFDSASFVDGILSAPADTTIVFQGAAYVKSGATVTLPGGSNSVATFSGSGTENKAGGALIVGSGCSASFSTGALNSGSIDLATTGTLNFNSGINGGTIGLTGAATVGFSGTAFMVVFLSGSNIAGGSATVFVSGECTAEAGATFTVSRVTLSSDATLPAGVIINGNATVGSGCTCAATTSGTVTLTGSGRHSGSCNILECEGTRSLDGTIDGVQKSLGSFTTMKMSGVPAGGDILGGGLL